MGEMSGKVCLVTGATSGIGMETAKALARLGATVAIVGRNPAKAEQVAEAIWKECGVEVAVFLADFSRMAEVRRMARAFKDRFDRLDILVNNAGAIHAQRQSTSDGFERTFALNHLAYFVLTQDLLDLLKASAPARIVNVSSRAHEGAQLPWDDLQSERHYSPMRTYGQSKLANILFTRELARRLEGSGVTANSLHPGVVATGFAVNEKGWAWTLWKCLTPFFLSPEQGAKTSIYLASSPEVENMSGFYFDTCKPIIPSVAAQDDGAARRLWELTERLLLDTRHGGCTVE